MSNLIAGKYLTTPPTLANGATEFLQLDDTGRLKVSATVSGGGDATAAKQDEQTALLTSINAGQRAQKYLMSTIVDITNIPVGGVDLRNLKPGKEPVLISGTLTSGSGQIHINLFDDVDDGSVKMVKNFGPSSSIQAVLGKLFDTTNPAILPLQVFYA